MPLVRGPWLSTRPTARKALLTAHILFAVSLLGDSAGYLAVAIDAANADDAGSALARYEILEMLALVFGIPLSFAALVTGLALSFGTKWSVFRYPWVTAKLLLLVSVILVGALVLNGAMEAMITGAGGAEGRLIAGAAYDVVALSIAVFLSVFKPGGRWRARG